MAKKNKVNSALAKGLDFLENIENDPPILEKGGEDIDVDNTDDITVPFQPVREFKQTAFGRETSNVYSLESGQLCPHCQFGVLEDVVSFSGKTCEFFVYCPNCNAYICTYKPMPHQEAFHKDPTLKKLYAGGFGSAKTYTCGMECIATVLQIPNSAALIGAATWGQASETCLKFITDNLPAKLVAKSNQDKVNWYIDLINGSRISAKAFDKEGKIRSANLSLIWIEEASEVEYELVTYIEARLRNKAAFYKGKNRLKMLLSSNPDVGWLCTEWLMKSSKIHYHGNVQDRYEVPIEDRDPDRVTHISATSANIYLPPNYEANLSRNKEQWWINRYLKGSFKYTEGLVYPNFSHWFCDPFPIPSHWKRVTGTDFGRRDPTAHVVGALDPIKKIIYVYAEVEEPLDDKPLEYMVKLLKQADNFPDYLLAYPHQCDPRGRNRDQVSGQSWIEGYREKGIIFQPAKDCEGNSIAPTIAKLASYADSGRLKIFSTCKKIRASLSKYKYPDRKVGEDKNQGEKPQDKHNHLPDALRYMLSPFPQFPTDPGDFAEVWREVMRRVERVYNPLLEDDAYTDSFVTDFTDNFG